MSVKERKERERAERHRLIIEAARELAEAEGWDAVTTRRLADRVEYSQPVLYSHFNGKDAIVAAVAIEGIGELAVELRRARTSRRAPKAALRALADAYLGFARNRPALYEAMFVRPTDIPFGTADSPAALREAFGEFLAVLEPVARDRDPETLAEVFWSALHGLAVLTRADRLRTSHHKARLDLLIDSLG
ncbi:TetR/AcrR family transcriptional regulator [Saccharopolyspora sp. K220]|uniref:TetR/AcrR family transcriptional regulator n=1 Tax=Saccharopolyspora soli TaxID=2926618 RepID=UPI001F55B54B|nr:TetR/AcrR family transcriptional regulator [Saccharopolyspora soli]MCI2418746.1 TetR/AcrR family transcriptional regulator [Saccharopolyspora soli]